ncbi:hypothetical protein HS088_TW13G00137 [Tripterygium wilfordii]|uniref:Uncharacterized protein n=1 Tax=Tripterygium wilfordii TaxID=458696 RepID=A0A7J7CTE4_TRIWF|nr:uncharacterized protein LOC120013658 [Tripterygium wilfordii]KAF5737258.1 hypothetical protein HS088_TW13G00137 [Tripterygium wilfordii]
MEDGVAENEGFHGAKERGYEEDHKGGDGAKTSGFMKNLISNWVSRGEDDETEGDDIGEGGVKEKAGGLLDHLTNLVSPKAGRMAEEKEKGASENHEGLRSDEEVDGSIGVGERLISNLKSKFLHQSEGEVTESGEKRRKIIEDEEETKKTISEEESGGIIDEIVSHLPPSLPAPTTDEAALLINSFVRD